MPRKIWVHSKDSINIWAQWNSSKVVCIKNKYSLSYNEEVSQLEADKKSEVHLVNPVYWAGSANTLS